MCLLQFAALAQNATVSFVKQFGGHPEAYLDAGTVRAAADGFIYTAGSFARTADFDPGPGVYSLTSKTNVDAYVLKLDAAGSFVWARHFATSKQSRCFGVTADASGNVYAAGDFEDTTDFDPGPGVYNLISRLPSEPTRSGFVVKLDVNGNFVWARKTEFFQLFAITLDIAGNIIASGEGQKSLIKLDTDGNTIWEKTFSGANNGGYVNNRGLTTDASGNIYTTGGFIGDADFDPGVDEFILHTVNSSGYVLKLDTDGNFIWVKEFAGAYEGGGIAIDNAGNILSTGMFNDTTDFDPGPDQYRLYVPAEIGGASGYVSKLDDQGNFVWAKQFTSGVRPTGLKTDAGGNVYTTGNISSIRADFDPGPVEYFLTNTGGVDDIYVSKLSSAGNFIWAKRMGGCYIDESHGLDIDNAGNLYIAGASFANAYFDQIRTTDTSNNLFIQKISPCSQCPITPLCIGNRVWNDLNKNGIDNNEPGMAGIPVSLYRDENNDNIADECELARTVTDINGNYSFCELAPGNYIVGIIAPAGYRNSRVNGGDPDNNIDKDNNGFTVIETVGPSEVTIDIRTKAITLSINGEPGANTNNTCDIGLEQGSLCLGNRVWNDLNNNGRDNNEPGLEGVFVGLYRVTHNNDDPFLEGAVMGNTVTDANGNYSFCSLFPGKYIVFISRPDSFASSRVKGGDPDNNHDQDNNGLFENDFAIWGLAITLSENQEPQGNINNTYDFGLHHISNNCNANYTAKGQQGEKIAATELVKAKTNNVYPNPFTNIITVQLQSAEAASAVVHIITMEGRILKTHNKTLVKGNNQLLLDGLEGIPPGMYILEIKSSGQTIRQKIIKGGK